MSDHHLPPPGPYGPPSGGLPPNSPPAGAPPRRSRNRWWRRLVGAARWWLSQAKPRPEPEPPMPFPVPAPVVLHRDPYRNNFMTPAKGDAYDFCIKVRFDWCSRAIATSEQERAAKEFELRQAVYWQEADVRERIKNQIRPIAREFEPYQPAELEQRLHDMGLCVELNNGELQVHARIWVEADPEVREAMRPGALDRLVKDSDRQTQEQQIARLRSLRAKWAGLLREALADMGEVDAARTGWLAPYPLALAEKPENAHERLSEMLRERRNYGDALLSGLSQTVKTHQELDVLDVVVQQDSALRAVMQTLGVPVGPRDEDLFGTDDEGGMAGVR